MLRFLLLLCLALPFSPAFAGVAGKFLYVAGDVKIIAPDGQTRIPKRGDTLNERETLATGKDGSAQLKMIDNGLMAVRPATRFTVDAFIYKGKADGSERSFITLLRGGFRAITGAIGKVNRDNYRVTTPVATIGIRGTDHEPFHILPPEKGEISLDKPGTYDKVNDGTVVLETAVGEVLIQTGQVGYVGTVNELPRLLPVVPDFYQVVAPTTPVPRTILPPGATSPPPLPPPQMPLPVITPPTPTPPPAPPPAPPPGPPGVF